MTWTRCGGCARGRRIGREFDGSVIDRAEAADAGADEPEEGRGVFRVVEEIGQVEGEEGEVVGCVDAGIDVPQEPFVEVLYALPESRVWGEAVAVVAGT